MKLHNSRRQLLVLLGIALYQFAFLGILINCSSVLFSQIRSDLGMSLSRVSVFHMLKNFTGALFGTVIISRYFRSNRLLFMILNIVLVVGSHLLLVIGADRFLWYVSAILLGVSYCTASIYVPDILSSWFQEGIGTATGFAMAFSGLGGVVFNPITSFLISAFGWKTAIVILCLLTAMIAALGLALIFCGAPAGTGDSASRPAHVNPFREKISLSSDFFLCCTAFLGSSLVMQFMQYISIYAQSIGYSLQIGAAMTSVLMAGNVVGKIAFGVFCDMFGIWKTMIATLAALIAATVCLMVFTNVLPILFVASFFYGLVAALATISVARSCAVTYGKEHSGKYQGLHTSIGCAVGAIFSVLIGLIYDRFGSYVPFLCIAVFTSVLSIISIGRLNQLHPAKPGKSRMKIEE